MSVNHGPLESDEIRTLFNAGGHLQPCYSCGKVRDHELPLGWICCCCGRPVCAPCWVEGVHLSDGDCRIPAASPEAQAEEWYEQELMGGLPPGGCS